MVIEKGYFEFVCVACVKRYSLSFNASILKIFSSLALGPENYEVLTRQWKKYGFNSKL